MKKIKKTNVMRLLDSQDIDYRTYSYKAQKDHVDGITAAEAIGQDLDKVYKTLVCEAGSKDHYVFVIPVREELDLKKAARAVGEKSIHMIRVSDINKITGYIRGGCSPIGMKKDFKTIINIGARERETIIVSAGKIGQQVELSPEAFKEFIDVDFKDVIV